MNKFLFLLVAISVIVFSCSAPKKLRMEQASYSQLDSAYLDNQQKLRDCQNSVKAATDENSRSKETMQAQIDQLNKQIDYLKANNNQALSELKDLSVISGTQAESIQKTLDNINAKDAYINSLQSALARKDSLNMNLVMNLKGALNNVNDQDINIKVEKDVVYINISDKMLFQSGSYIVTPTAKEVLGKVAQVLNAQPGLDFLVEGNTDNKPYSNGLLLDNWDLSTKRATAVVRILQNSYGIDPKRITAAGHSEYLPVEDNDSAEGRAANRRTRIIILPQLDQFFKLVEEK